MPEILSYASASGVSSNKSHRRAFVLGVLALLFGVTPYVVNWLISTVLFPHQPEAGMLGIIPILVAYILSVVCCIWGIIASVRALLVQYAATGWLALSMSFLRLFMIYAEWWVWTSR